MTLAEELTWRSLVQKSTFDDISRLDGQEWTLYIGFDASAPSQTVGNLAAMMAVRTFLRHGQRVILLAGGATSLVGDPGGKEAERELPEAATIARNIDKAVGQFKTVFGDFDKQITYVNNLDWYGDFKLLDFLRDVGKNFSVTPLIQRDFIASRLGPGGAGISYAEFSYTLLQGYDYLKLFEDYGCRLQLGGSDQWGNCLSGVDLIRRKHQTAVHALTLPLIINKATGKKFGKSENQTVWLDPLMSHPSDFYQFWLNTADEDALDYLKIFTSLNQQEVEAVAEEARQNPKGRPAQKKLAESVSRLVHGQEYGRYCQHVSYLAFFEGADRAHAQYYLDKKLADVQPDGLQIIIGKKPSAEALMDQLVEKVPAIASRGRLKTMVAEKALKIVSLPADGSGPPNRKTVTSLDELSSLTGHQAPETPLLLIAGKNAIRSLKRL